MIGQGEVWSANLGDPVGSGPTYRRPVLVVQGDALNRSALATVVCVPLSSQVKWARRPETFFSLRAIPASQSRPLPTFPGSSPSIDKFSKGALEIFRAHDS